MPLKFPTSATGQIAIDPRGAHVILSYHGRTLLGEVVGMRTADGKRMRVLTVRHFNGEPWPIEPFFLSVDVLER